MHWRLNKYIVEETIKFLRRVFAYNSKWNNKDIEFYEFDNGREELIYEQFAEKTEKYPIVAVGIGGGTLIPTGFNDLIKSVDDDIVQLGYNKSSTLLVDNNLTIKSKLPPGLNNVTVRGVSLEFAWSGKGVGGDDLNVLLQKGSGSVISTVASASLQGNISRDFQSTYSNFNTNVTLDNSDYYLVINSTQDSPYYIGIDNSINSYLYNNTGSFIQASGSVAGNLYLPAFIRLGGNFKGSLNLRVMSKNDTKTVYTLSELVSMYLTLAKHAQINRNMNNVDGMSLSNIDNNYLAEFLSKGIFIDQVKIGGLETRKRSEQEIIYIITISIDVLTEWFQDFPADTITDISVLIKTFIDKNYIEVWNSVEI